MKDNKYNIKLNNGILLIIISSLIVLGVIYFTVGKISNNPKTEEALKEAPDSRKIAVSELPGIQNSRAPSLQTDPDRAIIEAVVILSDDLLRQEFTMLGEHLRGQDLFSKLEQGLLDSKQKKQAIKLIERYTLLSLESTRRKYLAIEPELKDPLFAHRDSLKDIREITSKY